MRNIKGFCEIAALANNNANVVADFGELSTYALTFAKDKSYYSNGTSTDVNFVGFSVLNDSDVHFVLNNAVRDHILQVCQWVYDQYVGQLIPVEAAHASFITDIETQFPTITDVVAGTLVAGSGPTYNMPQYVEWQWLESGNNYTFKVWFIDNAFRAQYDLFEIRVINPLLEDADLDDLNDVTATVGLLLNAITPAATIAKIASVVGTTPATVVKTVSLLWHEPTLPASTLNTTWTLVIWGQAGDNPDNINQAIEDYIAANTALTLPEWQVMFPDLYTDTEFAVIPLWDYISSPETMLDYGLYSPTVRPNQMKQIGLDHAPPNYGDAFNMSTHLDLNLQLSQSTYRSLAFLIVSYPGNTGSLFKLTDVYSDYMNIPSTSGDFGRMSVGTQNFATELVTMMNHALTLQPADPAPVGYSKVVRSGKVYVAKEIDTRLWLVLTKYSYDNP